EIKSVNGGHACEISVTQTDENPVWPENAATAELVETWQRAADDCGFRLNSRPRGGLSDGNALWNLFPTLDGLGPRGGNVHCAQRCAEENKEPEYVDITSFVPKALLNCTAIQRLLAQS